MKRTPKPKDTERNNERERGRIEEERGKMKEKRQSNWETAKQLITDWDTKIK